ncbi:LysR family transcriptional regulator [Solicola gregarius]|uniref:LysR family transcriptional regulator n=1 Tax=Solicola gregarius TaxID=2908642 RepID=A0AA46TKI6_9ACTN|nr:LysR family transcriptional regulator [Solicola gregarius]UYM06785.1 LysR family transcriptional regulator [Solicola gregarius]
MDIRHLELLRELAERGSVTAVAAATHRTPSAVSQQLRTAQREFGVPLVEPHGRGVRLTEAGRVLARGAVGVATAVESARAEWDEFRHAPSGHVTMAGLASAAEYLVPAALRDLAARSIRVTFTDEDVAEADYAPLTVDHDIVIAHSLAERPSTGSVRLRIEPLIREPLDIALYSSHPLARRTRVTPEDVADESWIGVPPGFPFESVLDAVAARTGQTLRYVQRGIRDNRLVEAMVEAEHGLAVLPRFTTRPRDGVVLRPLAGVATARYIFALMRPDRAERLAVRHALDALVRSARAVASED